MRTLIAVATVLAFATSTGAALAATETFKIDPNHTRAGFSVRHFFTPVKGEFKNVSGTIEVDQANLNAAKVNVEIETASINTNNENRDKHLRSDDFFAAEKNPTITFVSKSLAIKDNKGTMTGDLTMRGITKPVTLDVNVLGFASMGKMGSVAGFTATGKVNRKDWDINWNRTLDSGGTMLSDDVDLEINVEAKIAPAAPPAGATPPAPPAAAATEKAGKTGATK
jgi:polyisoprenoid-binding protein YceI